MHFTARAHFQEGLEDLDHGVAVGRVGQAAAEVVKGREPVAVHLGHGATQRDQIIQQAVRQSVRLRENSESRPPARRHVRRLEQAGATRRREPRTKPHGDFLAVRATGQGRGKQGFGSERTGTVELKLLELLLFFFIWSRHVSGHRKRVRLPRRFHLPTERTSVIKQNHDFQTKRHHAWVSIER